MHDVKIERGEIRIESESKNMLFLINEFIEIERPNQIYGIVIERYETKHQQKKYCVSIVIAIVSYELA